MVKPDPYLAQAQTKNDILTFCQKKSKENGIINTTIVWVKLYNPPRRGGKFYVQSKYTKPEVKDFLKLISEDGYLVIEKGNGWKYNSAKADPFLDSGGYTDEYTKKKDDESMRIELERLKLSNARLASYNHKVRFVFKMIWLIPSTIAILFNVCQAVCWFIGLFPLE